MKKVLKWVLGTIPVLLTIGALGAAVYFASNPDAARHLEEKLNSVYDTSAPRLELTSQVQHLEHSYCFPEDTVYPALPRESGAAQQYEDILFTWFRDVDGDLWLPHEYLEAPVEAGEAFVCTRDGIVKLLEAGVCTVNPARGEIHVPRTVLEDLPEGDYYFGIWIENNGWGDYYGYALAVRDDASVVRSDQVGIATKGDGLELMFNLDQEEELTFHLYNLGENRITRVSAGALDSSNRVSDGVPLKEEDYVIAEDGHSVTFTREYLDSRILLTPYYYAFELGDGTKVTTYEDPTAQMGLVFYDDSCDLPYASGPSFYSLSSGEDYVFTLHLGDAGLYESPECGLWVEPSYPLQFVRENIREDETYVIPASVMQEAAKTVEAVRVNAIFHVAITYYRGSAYDIYLVP